MAAPAKARDDVYRNGGSAQSNGNGHAHHSHDGRSEQRSVSGWGRAIPPPIADDVFAYRYMPWSIVAATAVIATLSITYAIAGAPHSSWWAPYAYAVIIPVAALTTAAAAFVLVAVTLSHILSPPTSGHPERFFTFKNAVLKRDWSGRAVPIQSLYEAFFNDEIALAVDPETNAPYDLLDVLYQRHTFSRFVIEWAHVRFFMFQFIPELLMHSRGQDVEQVRAHYDRGDDFYAAFLGPSMVYTSAIFQSVDDTLEQAQTHKMKRVAEKLQMRKGDAHLDFGCGWGTFIAHCAKEYGTNSVGITLGRNQTEWANAVCKSHGVSDRARALCMDYRDAPLFDGERRYDKITCLEMSEHVGVRKYSAFCRQVYDLLEDDGLFFLQIAGLRRAWQFEDFCWGLFMGKYIFPGADASCPLGSDTRTLTH